MRVISKSRLREFWERPGCQGAKGPLVAWNQRVNSRSAIWRNWGDVKRDYPTASSVGNCTVFNIAGNKYRLVVRIIYQIQKVFVLKVMTHAQYDQESWKAECGCFTPPPPRPGKIRRPSR
jgi:mRNA interferase HigB